MVVGQHLGVQALAALGTADWTAWMITGIAQGFAQGFSILMAQHFGAGKIDKLRKTVANAVILTAICAVLLLFASEACIPLLLRLLQVPTEIHTLATTYLRILFAGVPVVMAYNLLASILRSLGDSKNPLYAMIIASVVNIVLDILFVMVFEMGIGGAALGTIIAQTFSAIYCLFKIRKISMLKLRKSDWKLEWTLSAKLMYLGLPMAFMNTLISVGGMIVTTVVNGFGVIFIAGFTATNKLYCLLEVAAVSFGYAMATFAGQNLGANRLDRVKKGTKMALLIAMITSVMIAAAMLLFGKLILGCFISTNADGAQEALRIAFYYLSVMSVFLPILYVLHILRSSIQGMGNTLLPMLSGIAEFIMRCIAALTLPALLGETGVFFAEICAWVGADVVLIASYFYVIRKVQRRMENL